jgi:hypothetical protein
MLLAQMFKVNKLIGQTQGVQLNLSQLPWRSVELSILQVSGLNNGFHSLGWAPRPTGTGETAILPLFNPGS